MFEKEGFIGVGCVVRDVDGGFIGARNHRVPVSMQHRETEAVSLKEALSWIKQTGYMYCIFETDAKLIADACKELKGIAYFHTIVSDCLKLFKHFENVLFDFVSRSANGVTHKLARATHFMLGIHESFYTALEFVRDILLIDFI
ncbi:uncharacterized protein LOC141680056 [Apium graveolens]|uniref:uncharacterized protein LOC141680056 n=1 Tax=Apium graveolens TaxID=4045 RepID=UPI003D79BAF7